MNLHSIYCLNQTRFPISNIISFYNIHYYSYVAHSRLAKDRCLFTKVRPHSKILLTTAIIPVQTIETHTSVYQHFKTCMQRAQVYGLNTIYMYLHWHMLQQNRFNTICANIWMKSCLYRFVNVYTLVQMSFYYRYTACTIYQTVKRNCSFTSVYKRGGDWINA